MVIFFISFVDFIAAAIFLAYLFSLSLCLNEILGSLKTLQSSEKFPFCGVHSPWKVQISLWHLERYFTAESFSY